MTDASATSDLKIPKAVKAAFARNFIKLAVCELRFPTLFELVENDVPPNSFARALRKEYPHHGHTTTVVNDGNPAAVPAKQHGFRSKNQHWTVSLRSNAVVLETSRYTSFEEFRERLALVTQAAEKVIDSDFYTRIGLRFINAIPYDPINVGDWINADLVKPLAGGIFGAPLEAFSRVRGTTEIGGFMMQHGIGVKTIQKDEVEDGAVYTLDLDIYCEDIDISDALKKVDALHEIEYSLFNWALGPAAKQHLGPSKLEKKSV